MSEHRQNEVYTIFHSGKGKWVRFGYRIYFSIVSKKWNEESALCTKIQGEHQGLTPGTACQFLSKYFAPCFITACLTGLALFVCCLMEGWTPTSMSCSSNVVQDGASENSIGNLCINALMSSWHGVGKFVNFSGNYCNTSELVRWTGDINFLCRCRPSTSGSTQKVWHYPLKTEQLLEPPMSCALTQSVCHVYGIF